MHMKPERTPNNVFWALMVVESSLCNFKWTSKHPFVLLCFLGLGTKAAGLRHQGLGTWRPALLDRRLLTAELRHLGLGT